VKVTEAEIWNTRSRNLVEEFETVDEALVAARGYAEMNDSEPSEWPVSVFFDDGRSMLVQWKMDSGDVTE
jgi:hypothetical protein